MANTRQTIIDAVKTRLAAISGIQTVAIWRASDLAPSELPALIIRDTVDQMPSDGIGSGRRDHDLTVEILALFAGNTAAASARDMVADIVAAIGTDPTWSGSAYDSILESAELDLDDAAQLIASAQISLTIRYRTAMWSI